MKKRGAIWISAVIYIALGIIAITLIIGAGVPLINKVRDRNTFQQTKELMHTLDEAVQEVLSEGPGSQRFLSPVTIKEGDLFIKGATQEAGSGQDIIIWLMETKAVLMEPNVVLNEGHLKIGLTDHPVLAETYVVNITMDYFIDEKIVIEIDNEDRGPLRGKNSISITNLGLYGGSATHRAIGIDVR